MTDMELQEKTPSQSRTEMVQIVYNAHINGSRRLFGGRLMEWIDTVGAVVARRHAGCEVTTAAVDTLRFQEGVTLNSTLVLIGTVTYTGRTSMEVRVDTFLPETEEEKAAFESGERRQALRKQRRSENY